MAHPHASFEEVIAACKAAEIHEVIEKLPNGYQTEIGERGTGLSGGQRQRVAVGRAIVRQPKLFLFDEPLSNLDAKMRVHMRLEIAKLYKRLEATIIYVTHDQLEAMTLATSVALMKDGMVQQVAPPLDIYNSPKNKYNPDPTKAVRWGDPTYDEMMIGFISYTKDGQNLKEAAINTGERK